MKLVRPAERRAGIRRRGRIGSDVDEKNLVVMLCGAVARYLRDFALPVSLAQWCSLGLQPGLQSVSAA